jgi:hypothetical protein
MRSFQVEIDGVRYQGAWLQEGSTLRLRSDYGTVSVMLDGREPAALAREVLRQLACPRPAWA